MSVEQTDSQNGVSRPSGAAGAWMQTDKKWGQRDNPLKIHFLNPDVLEDENWMCGEGQMNIDNILAWARRWNNKAFPDIPNFGFTNSAEKAHIRVNFGSEYKLVNSDTYLYEVCYYPYTFKSNIKV